MISVQEVVVDPDMIAPQPYTILRSTGRFVAGGFQSTVTPISMFGPVHQASDKEIQMLPEADRVGAVRSFWSTRPIYVTRGYAPVPSVHGEVPTGSDTAYSVSAPPPGGVLSLYSGGLLLQPNGADYTLAGASIAFVVPPSQPLYATWPITANVATDASDQIQYETEIYRIMHVFRVPGSGYWKALGTRLAAA